MDKNDIQVEKVIIGGDFVKEIADMQRKIDIMEHYIVNLYNISRLKSRLMVQYYYDGGYINGMVADIANSLYELADMKKESEG